MFPQLRGFPTVLNYIRAIYVGLVCIRTQCPMSGLLHTEDKCCCPRMGYSWQPRGTSTLVNHRLRGGQARVLRTNQSTFVWKHFLRDFDVVVLLHHGSNRLTSNKNMRVIDPVLYARYIHTALQYIHPLVVRPCLDEPQMKDVADHKANAPIQTRRFVTTSISISCPCFISETYYSRS